MLASKEDEGATIRIEDLERRGALAERGARRIHERGLEIQEEYKDEVHHLQGLLGNTESRLQQMQYDSSLARNVAEKLYQECNEMQKSLENTIVEYRNHSKLATFSHTHLEMASQRQTFAVNELTDENQMLSEALVHSRKQAELYENNMEQITREYRKKINEAIQAKLESDLRHRSTEHDTMKRFASKGLKLKLGFPQGSGVSPGGGSPSAQIKLRFSQDQDHRRQIPRLTRLTDMYCRSCQDCRVPRRSLGVRRGYVGAMLGSFGGLHGIPWRSLGGYGAHVGSNLGPCWVIWWAMWGSMHGGLWNEKVQPQPKTLWVEVLYGAILYIPQTSVLGLCWAMFGSWGPC